MMEAILKIRMPDNWVKDVGEKFPDSIKFLDCMPYGESGGRGLIELRDSETAERIAKEIRKHPDVCKVDITDMKDGGSLGSVVTNKCLACRALTGSDCFLTSAITVDGGNVEWKLITGAQGALQGLVETLKAAGCEVELKKTTRISKKSMLTDRQEEIIRMAFEKGYYDYPKKTTIKKLASIFEISPSTLAEILQRGERKIISGFFGETTSKRHANSHKP